MRAFLLILIAAIIGLGLYAYNTNPAACRKLGTDIVADANTIFKSGAKSDTPPPATENTVPHPVVAEATKHFQQGFAEASDTGDQTAATPIPTPDTAAASPAPAPSPTSLPSPAPAPAKFMEFNDYALGLSEARAENKPMLVEFTGTDWSEFSQELDGDVTSKPEFKQFVAEHFIFVVINLPRQKLDPEEPGDKHIIDLETRYSIHDVPTLLVVDTEERQRGRVTGYGAGNGVASVIASLKAVIPR